MDKVITNEELQEREGKLGLMYAGPSNLPNYQNHHIIKPSFSEYPACNGSLSDMLLPSNYKKPVDDPLIILEHHLNIPNPPLHQINQHSTMVSHIPNPHSIKDFLIIDDHLIISPPHHKLITPPLTIAVSDAPKFALPLAPPSLMSPPWPAHTRRPPLRKGTPSYRDNHINSERKRRQDMTSLFDKLRSVLPNMQSEDLKVDRCTIVGHVIEYVQELDRKVQALGKVKAELEQANGWKEEEGAEVEKSRATSALASLSSASTSLVSVRLCGPLDIFITLNCPKQRGFWPHLLSLLQDTLHLHVHNIALSSTPLFCIHSIYAKVMGSKNEEVCCDKLQKILSNFVANHNIMC